MEMFYFLTMDEYKNRIVKGKIQLVGSNYLNLRLLDTKGFGRLPYENMINPPPHGTFDQYYSKGQILTVFLEQNDSKDKNNMFKNKRLDSIFHRSQTILTK